MDYWTTFGQGLEFDQLLLGGQTDKAKKGNGNQLVLYTADLDL